MRILYSHRIQSRDGQSVHVEALVAALRTEGHEVMVVGPGLYERATFGGGGGLAALVRRALPRSVGELAELAYNLPAYVRLRSACAGFRPDIIYERYNLFYLAGALLARRRGLPFYVEVNSPLADERRDTGLLSFERIARLLERFTWRSADRIFAVTGPLRDLIVAQGAPAARVEVVHNGTEPEEFPLAATRADRAERVVLGFIGFVRAWHGLDAVLRAMAGDDAAEQLNFVVAGEGPARPELERIAKELDLDGRVHFTGLVARAEVPDLLASFDIALQPSVVSYASPLKIFEYMAAGLAIVAPDQPNIREILTEGETALLFDPGQPEAMWRAVVTLAADPALRRRLGRAAREDLIRRRFTWRDNAARVVAGARADLAARAPHRPGVSKEGSPNHF
jgi:glycosyltransferase involved in cell wall biosynthesis